MLDLIKQLMCKHEYLGTIDIIDDDCKIENKNGTTCFYNGSIILKVCLKCGKIKADIKLLRDINDEW